MSSGQAGNNHRALPPRAADRNPRFPVSVARSVALTLYGQEGSGHSAERTR